MAEMSEQYRRLEEALAERYAIERELGQGAFATVFLARDLRHDRSVAIKLLHAEYENGEHELRFHREIRLLARLQHPHILPLHDSGQVHDMLFYVVPYVQGHSLRDRIDRDGALPIDDVVRFAREIADALEYAHRQGVIHRDIKPENILLSGAHAILADFGVALAIDRSAGNRLTRTSVGGPGTPLYMSPEQLLGEHDADARSDIYSMGSVIYEMVTGKPPFEGAGGFARRFTQPPPSCAPSRPDVPSALDRIVVKSLALAPEERFLTAGELARALDDVTHVNENRTSAPSRMPFQPPVPSSSSRLIGRATELAELALLLSESRLVTLVGPGGVGKTSLALQCAADAQPRFRDGCLVVLLGAVLTPDLVVPAIAEAMQLTFGGPREPRLQLLDALHERNTLLVLDNFEHLMAATELIAAIVEAAPRVSILVTSRERLNLSDESVVDIHGLDTDRSGDAFALFVERARRSAPRFAPTARDRHAIDEICALVGGLPLGIEIAASLVRVLSCAEIAAELVRDPGALTTPLRDVPDRHRSLRAVFERSWNLLDDAQRLVLTRLSLFHGPFYRDAAERIAAATIGDLMGLLDKSLLQRTAGGGFALHAVVRQFAEVKLRAWPDVAAATEDARSEYYAQWLRLREDDACGARLYEFIDEVGEHLEGIRHGWRHALRRGHEEDIRTYVAALLRFYIVRGRYREGVAELAHADQHRLSVRTTALHLARRAALALHGADMSESLRLARSSVSVLRPVAAASAEMGIALAQLGFVANTKGKHRASTRLYGRALALLRAHGASETEIAFTLLRQGIAQAVLGQYTEAEATYRAALRIFNGTCEPRARIMTMTNLAIVLHQVGRTADALELRQKVLAIAESTRDWFLRAAAEENLADSLAEAGRVDEARALVKRALEGFRTGGRRDGIVPCELTLGQLEREAGDLSASEEHVLNAIGAASEIGATPYVMEGVCELAILRALQRRPDAAAKLADVASRHAATPEQSRRKARALLDRLTAEHPGLAERAVPEIRFQADYGKLLEIVGGEPWSGAAWPAR